MKSHKRLASHGTVPAFVAVGVIHAVGWGLLIATADWSGRASAIAIGAGVLAYMLGLRHAFDADHIAAIDNSTRRLINSGRSPGSAGLFFSLGHSTVVFVVTALIAFGLTAVGTSITDEKSPLRIVGGAVGTAVSGGFLVVIALLNAIVLVSLIRAARNLRSDEVFRESDDLGDQPEQSGGLLTRVFKPVIRIIDRPWKMFPLGILFGLGFDTASSVAMLTIAGGSSVGGGNRIAILSLPLIFMAGMSLGDTVDGYLMQRAYGWAADHNSRRIRYNILVTTVSVIAAFAIGLPLLLTFVANSFGLTGPAWDFIRRLDFEYVGVALFGLFLLMWATGWILWRARARKFVGFESRSAQQSVVSSL